MCTILAVSLRHTPSDTTVVKPALMIGGRGRSDVDIVIVELGTNSSVGRVSGNRYVEGRRQGEVFRLQILYRNIPSYDVHKTTSEYQHQPSGLNDSPVGLIFVDPVPLIHGLKLLSHTSPQGTCGLKGLGSASPHGTWLLKGLSAASPQCTCGLKGLSLASPQSTCALKGTESRQSPR